ncbi:hypothetical protein V2G26_016069 [Clonostachys chloroleuca]
MPRDVEEAESPRIGSIRQRPLSRRSLLSYSNVRSTHERHNLAWDLGTMRHALVPPCHPHDVCEDGQQSVRLCFYMRSIR